MKMKISVYSHNKTFSMILGTLSCRPRTYSPIHSYLLSWTQYPFYATYSSYKNYPTVALNIITRPGKIRRTIKRTSRTHLDSLTHVHKHSNNSGIYRRVQKSDQNHWTSRFQNFICYIYALSTTQCSTHSNSSIYQLWNFNDAQSNAREKPQKSIYIYI